MNQRLLAYLRKLGLRRDATEEQTAEFLASLRGSQRAIANLLNYDEVDESARTACDQMLRASGWDTEDPTRVLQRQDPEPEPVTPAEPAPVETPEPAEPPREEQMRAIVSGLDWYDSDDLADAILDTTRTVDQFRAEVRQQISERRANRVGSDRPGGPAIHSRSRDEDLNCDTLAALCMRRANLNPVEHACRNVHGVLFDRSPSQQDTLEQAAERSERYQYLRPWEIVREAAIRGGTNVGHSPQALFDALSTRATAMSTANIANVFTTTFSASLLRSYNEYPDTTQWCMANYNLPDFNSHEHPRVLLGENMSLHARGGEAEHTTYSDKMEEYKAHRYSKQFVVDEMDIMDDHRFNVLMTNTPADFGRMAARVRPDLVYSILFANAALADTGALFNATAVTTAGGHANLTTSAAIAAATLKAGLTKLNTMTENGKILAPCIQPFLLTGETTHWTAAELNESAKVLAFDQEDTTSSVIGDKNVLAGVVRPIKDARIDLGVADPSTDYVTTRTSTATDWYLIANPQDRHTVEVGYVQGTNGRPTIRSKVLDGGQWGVSWDVKLDIGAKALDYLGMQKFTA